MRRMRSAVAVGRIFRCAVARCAIARNAKGDGRTAGAPTLRLAAPLDRLLRGPDKYRILELKRRRAQIRARRMLGLR
jgi:hypothetical protein